jgi:Flp pilus assembly protein CpaB
MRLGLSGGKEKSGVLSLVLPGDRVFVTIVFARVPQKNDNLLGILT